MESDARRSDAEVLGCGRIACLSNGEAGSDRLREYTPAMTGGHRRITSVAWSSFAENAELRWQPPLLDQMQSPEYAKYQWRRIQLAFPALPDPAAIPRMRNAAFAPNEEEAIGRYLRLAPELARASLFASDEDVTISIDDDGSEAIEATASARDITAGFLVTWRQFYSSNEPASFDRVRGYLMREAKNTPSFEPIKLWGRAGGQLKSTHLEHLVLEGLANRGEIPAAVPAHGSTHDPANVDNPQMLISKQLYGDLVHWGDKRGELAAIADDRFRIAWERLAAVAAAIALGYIYIGFASVIATALDHAF